MAIRINGTTGTSIITQDGYEVRAISNNRFVTIILKKAWLDVFNQNKLK